jgi:membrane-associated phospholipid phosphatase
MTSVLAPLSARAETPLSPLASQDEVVPTRAFEPRLAGDLGGDGRRTLGRFVPNLGRNIVGVFAKDNLRPLLFGVAGAGLASRLDNSTQNFFGPTRRAEDFGQYGQKLGGAAFVAPTAAALLILGHSSSDPRFRGVSYDMAQAFVVNGLYTTVLKAAVGRERPDGSNNLSFPSGHASNAFAWATVANHHYGAKVGIPAYALAGLIGVSRLESNAHHLSDVVAGAALGVIVGRSVVRQDGETLRRKATISVMPMTDASGSGLGAGLSIAF